VIHVFTDLIPRHAADLDSLTTHAEKKTGENAGALAPGFDVLILSDLLHFDTSHAALAESVVALLGRDTEARVYAAAGESIDIPFKRLVYYYLNFGHR